MNTSSRLTCRLAASWVLALAAAATVQGDASTRHATGTFEVETKPLTAEDASGGGIAKLSLDKQFHGDLEATSKGAMLATGSASGNGAYVALEIVTGKLKGREGSFVLQHSGIATQGGPSQLNIIVVPHSGTGKLSTLTGRLNIVNANGKHSYELDYSLAN